MQDPLLDCEDDIRSYLEEHATTQCPPLLARQWNMRFFPGGARVRPQLCMAVALANNSSDRPLAAAAATAVEFLHCASLVHDDLPCFDDATERRGKAVSACQIWRAYRGVNGRRAHRGRLSDIGRPCDS